MLDLVTGIGNKAYFTYYFENAISEQARILYKVAYIAFDIRHTNTCYGKEESENILRYAANVLTQNAADNDIVARVSGGGFAMAFQAENKENAQMRMEHLLKQLNEYGKKYLFDHEVLFCIGIYSLNQEDRSSETVLYNAKQGYLYALDSHLPYAFINEHLLQFAQEQTELQQQITSAFQHNEFQLYLQFIVDRHTQQICGAEALSRWQHSQRGVLTPDQYVNFMIQIGDISKLDFYMFEKACQQLLKWNHDGLGKLWISCNFTRITISNEKFTERLFSIAQQYAINPSRVVIEITEDTVEENATIAFNNIAACKKAGFRIALDDFGAGYTSFRNLSDYAIDYIKIDRSIVLNAETENGKALLEGLIALAHSLQMKVLCEGVENEQQNEVICATQCDMIQGYYYSRNIPQEETEAFLNEKGVCH